MGILAVFVLGCLMPFADARQETQNQISVEGDITEHPITTPASNPQGITIDPATGYLWFTERTGNHVSRMMQSGVYTSRDITTGGSIPAGITIDTTTDDLWFTEVTGNHIAKMTQLGVCTEYDITTPASNPIAITIDPSTHELWFTESAGNKIGKMTQAGVCTEYPVTTASSLPNGIVINPTTHDLWFTETNANHIGKMTQAGVCTEYDITTGGSTPVGITIDPTTQYLWFTESAGNKIGKMTTSGVCTEYPVTTASSQPTQITFDATTGNLWFTEYNGNKIGKMTRTGVCTEFAITTSGSEPIGIVCDESNGNIWFTEYDANNIGMAEGTSPASITIDRPVGDETWFIGNSENIFWNITDGTKPYSVWVNYSTDGGGIWHSAHAKITQAGKGQGTFAWTIPDEPSDDCVIEMSILDNDMRGVIADSDGFNIDYLPILLSITNPAGGEEWEVGSVHNIHWTAEGGDGDLLINISYATAISGSFTNVTNDEENDGSYTWTIPDDATDTAFVKIDVYDERGYGTNTTSEMFSIIAVEEPPVTQNDITIQVTHPTTSYKGDTITIHADVSIVSSGTDKISTVTIYYRYSGTAYQSITMDVDSGDNEDGSWIGTIPKTTKTGTIEFYVKAIADNGDFASTTLYTITIGEQSASATPSATIFTTDMAIATGVILGAIILSWLAWTVKPAVVIIIVGAVAIIAYVFVM